MTDSLDGPNLAARLDRALRRIDDLERRLRARVTERPTGYVYWEAVFSQGTPLTLDGSGRYPMPFTGELYEAVATNNGDLTDDADIDVLVNDGVQGAINVASGDWFGSIAMSNLLQATNPPDYATVQVTDAGDVDALVVVLRFRRAV